MTEEPTIETEKLIQNVIPAHQNAFGEFSLCIVNEYIYSGEGMMSDFERQRDPNRLEDCSLFRPQTFTIESPQGLVFTICMAHVDELKEIGVEKFKEKYGEDDGLYWEDWDADAPYPSDEILKAIVEDTSMFQIQT